MSTKTLIHFLLKIDRDTACTIFNKKNEIMKTNEVCISIDCDKCPFYLARHRNKMVEYVLENKRDLNE